MQLVLDFPVTPRFSFDNFVVCEGNETAFRFAQRVLDPNQGENILYIYGPSGSGKTHLLSAISKRLAEEEGSEVPILTIKPDGIACSMLKEAPAQASLSDIFANAGSLLIDDLHQMPPNHDLHVQIWQLFNDFFQQGKRIVITGLLPPKELPNLDEHLISRLLWGLAAQMDISDDNSRRKIMQKLASDRQIILPDDVIDYLLKHLSRDLPTLIDTLDRIVHYSLATGRKVTLRLAGEVLNC